MTDKSRLAGTLRISLPTGGRFDENETFQIIVKDELSGVVFAEIELSPADLAKAMACRQADCSFVLHDLDLVGKKREHKIEFVPASEGLTGAERLEAFEIEGWRAHNGDLKNSHRSSTVDGVYGHRVGFWRYIDVKTGEPVL